jgi:S-phase kinase-associated protein 1
MADTTTTTATVKLSSNDGKEFTVERSVAEMSVTLKNMLEDIGDIDQAIPVTNVNGKILEKVIQYCQYHKENPEPPKAEEKEVEKRSDDISPWDQKFCDVPQNDLFELILAANFLDIKPLLDVTCKTVANMIKGKTPEQIRETFGIENDFTPEEEEQIRRENAWCEDK